MARPALVSIVIPAYNAARYLRESIDSVLAQTYASLQIIVVDDGSVDETPAILDSYGATLLPIRQPNSGQSAALERGWRTSAGDLLGYLSADDRLHRETVATLVSTLEQESSAVLAYSDFNVIDEAGTCRRVVRMPPYDQRELIGAGRCLVGPGALFRRLGWQKTGGWNAALRQMPDYDFLLRLSLVGPFVHIPRSLADFRIHAGSATYSPSSFERAEEPLSIMKSFFERSDLPAKVRRWHRPAMANALMLSAYRHARSGRAGWGAWRLLQAAGQHPASLCSIKTASYAANILKQRLGLLR